MTTKRRPEKGPSSRLVRHCYTFLLAASITGAGAFAPPSLLPGVSPSTTAIVRRRRRTDAAAASVVPSTVYSSSSHLSFDDNRNVRSFSLRAKSKASSSDIGDDDDEAASSSLGDIALLVLPLLFVYISNQWSRASIYYLVDFSSPTAATSSSNIDAAAASADLAFRAMNVDLAFDQSQYGLLASAAFTSLFAVCSLAAGSLADRYDRKILTMGGAVAWTLATFAQSGAQSYEEVAAARVAMGAACAFCVPAGYSLIAEKISGDRAALANSLYGSGVYAGGALASLTVLLDERWEIGRAHV